tara:strand:+ start:526 stop:1119 length:594 start_codon:yes stop_codon:yes gene_type:complete
MKFDTLVSPVTERIIDHHKLYKSICKSEYWEENFYWALEKSGFGSNWTPHCNHKPGIDQKIITNKISISNKSGTYYPELGLISISGSRLTKHETFEDKLKFLSEKKEDYIACLATDKDEWKLGIRKYYFAIINSDKLNYGDQIWTKTMGSQKRTKGKLTGWKCFSEDFSATIQRGTSDQLWTSINIAIFDEIHEIKV